MTVDTAPVEKGQDRTYPMLNSSNSIFVIDSEGILVLNKDTKTKKVTIKGMLEPDKFLDGITANVPLKTELLPNNTKYYERFRNNRGDLFHIFAFEFEPRVYSLQYTYPVPLLGPVNRTYSLSLPYVQFYICLKQIDDIFTTGYTGVSCTQKSIELGVDPVFFLPLHNIRDESGSICWFNAVLSKRKDDTLSGYARKVASHFFSAKFNNHLFPKYPDEMRKAVIEGRMTESDNRTYPKEALETWEKLSADDPQFILRCKLAKYNSIKNFDEMINHIRSIGMNNDGNIDE